MTSRAHAGALIMVALLGFGATDLPGQPANATADVRRVVQRFYDAFNAQR